LEGLQYKLDQPTIYKYSFDVDREVLANTSVNLGYSGTRGVHLLRVVSTNVPIAQEINGRLFIPTNAPFVHPLWSRVRPRISDAESDYHAMRLTVNRRFSSGLQLTGAYTLSKATDDASNWAGSGDWSNSPGNSRYSIIKDKGLAAFDIRRNLVINFTYDLPGRSLTGAAGKVLGGWQTSGIFSARDGIPFTVTVQAPSHFTNVGGYPDVAPGNKGYTYETRNVDRYFGISSFTPPPTNTVGNAGRTILIGPGAAKFDWVLVKQTSLTERVSLQFRSEFFNLFNRANFNTPSGTRLFVRSGAVDPAFGRITGTTTSARQVQFGMRLVF
jgi:hypothetical protein